MKKQFNREPRELRESGKKGGIGISLFSVPCSRISRLIRGRNGAFTLLELLLVVAIIGILATVALPHMVGFGKSNAMTAATRQVLDDVASARQRAMSTRSTVYMIFVPRLTGTLLTSAHSLTNCQYAGYALYSPRSVGDQPGRPFPRYLSDWKTLPQGVYFATNKFGTATRMAVTDLNKGWTPSNPLIIQPFLSSMVRFPNIDHGSNTLLCSIAFSPQGGLPGGDEYIPLTRGSVMMMPPTETPVGNSTNNYNIIHIDAVTGRAKLERQEIQ